MDVPTLERLILRTIRKGDQVSRRELADTLDIARSTAGRRVDSLIERGLLYESGTETRSTVGRPRRFLEFDPKYGGFMGLDFDARRIHGVVINFGHEVVVQESVKLPPQPNAKYTIKKIRQLKQSLREKAGKLPILSCGMGVPGRVHRESLTALEYPFIEGWKDINLGEALEGACEDLRIENNTRANALGEYWFGRNAGSANLLCLNVRTGISAATIANGVLISGGNEMAGEIRSWPAWNPLKNKGLTDGLEDSATIRAISEQAQSTDDDEWKEFCAACNRKDKSALTKLESIASFHGGAAAMALQLTDPHAVVITGWFTQLGELYLGYVQKAATKALEGHWNTQPTLQLSTLGEYAGALGAAAMASYGFTPPAIAGSGE